MNKKFFWAILIVLIAAAGIYFRPNFNEKTGEKTCFTIENYRIVGHSMEPLLADGTYIKGLAGYYECSEVQKGEIVILEFKSRKESFVKKIIGIAGDKIEFAGEQLKLNGEILKNSGGETYAFSEASRRIITASLNNGIILEGRYFILGEEKGPSAYDSRQFGLVEKEHLKGRVINSISTANNE